MEKIAQLYKGNFEEVSINFSRVWAMPSAWTFSIHPIQVLIDRYVDDGKGWIDPYAGKYSPAEITNDHNPERSAGYCMEAIDFVNQLSGRYRGILFDPPYSFTQIKEHYIRLNKPRGIHTGRMGFYEKVKSAACEKILPGGHAISCGWNTNGFGKARGFKIVEIMAVAHGGSKNDTTITIERKESDEANQ